MLLESEDIGKIGVELSREAQDESTHFIDDVIKSRLESHEADRTIFENFRAALAELAAALSSDSERSGQGGPLVFIIDELDRCRPSFALGLLEKIKHFFSATGVVFILVGNLAQLRNAVQFAYGDIDALRYLDKFYHMRILFPAGNAIRPDLAVETYLRHLQCNQNVADIIDQFCRVLPTSLRTIERIVTYTKIAEVSIPKGSLWSPDMIATLGIIKVLFPELYDSVRNNKAKAVQIQEALRYDLWRGRNNPERTAASNKVEQLWAYVLEVMHDNDAKKKMDQTMGQYGLRSVMIIPYFCDLIDAFSLPESERDRGLFSD